MDAPLRQDVPGSCRSLQDVLAGGSAVVRRGAQADVAGQCATAPAHVTASKTQSLWLLNGNQGEIPRPFSSAT